MGAVIPVSGEERGTGLSRRGRSGTGVLWNIGQVCELVYNPAQPECKLHERKEQEIKWGNRLRISASRVLP